MESIGLPSAVDVQVIETTPDIIVFSDSTNPGQDASMDTADTEVHIVNLCEGNRKDPRISQTVKSSKLETASLCKDTISAIARKYKLRRKQDLERHRRGVMKKHFVCEHCGLVSRCGIGLKKRVNRMSEKQTTFIENVQRNRGHVSINSNYTSEDAMVNVIDGKESETFRREKRGDVSQPVAVGNDNDATCTTAVELKPYLCGKCSQGFLNIEPLVKHVATCFGESQHKNVADEGKLHVKSICKVSGREHFDKDEAGVRRTRSGRKVGYIVHKTRLKARKNSETKGKQRGRKKLQVNNEKVVMKTRSGRKDGNLMTRNGVTKPRVLKDGFEDWKSNTADTNDETEMEKNVSKRKYSKRALPQKGQISELEGKRRGRRKIRVNNEKMAFKNTSAGKGRYILKQDKNVGNDDKVKDDCGKLIPDIEENNKVATRRKKDSTKSELNPNNECAICHKTFAQRSSLYRHHSLVHKGIKKHECRTCHKRYQQKHNLTLHKCLGQRSPVSKSLLCIMCGKSFASVSSLRHHERTLHTKTKRFSCPTCGRAFSSAGNMREHLRAVHNGRSYLCDLCGKSFSFKNSYNRHQRYHSGLKPYKCKQCERNFSSREGRQLHEMTHMVAEKVQCEYCGKRMKNLLCVAYHMKKHHSTEENRFFQCYRCDTKYNNNINLAQHMEECQKNQHVCQYCFKTFSSKSNLTHHLRTHSSGGIGQTVQM